MVLLAQLVRQTVEATQTELRRISRSTCSDDIRQRELEELLRTAQVRFAQLVALARWAPRREKTLQDVAKLRELGLS